MCGFLITSTTSDCAIVEKYVSKVSEQKSPKKKIRYVMKL